MINSKSIYFYPSKIKDKKKNFLLNLNKDLLRKVKAVAMKRQFKTSQIFNRKWVNLTSTMKASINKSYHWITAIPIIRIIPIMTWN